MAASILLLGLTLTASVYSQNPYTNATDPNGNRLPSYSPARPPALPLAVRSPYTNAWTSTSANGTLNTNGVIFWPDNVLGWEGMVTVDGISYEYLGTGSQNLPNLTNLKPAVPLAVSYDSQYSNFTFAAGPVDILASFFSPVIPKDLCRTSIPLSYLSTTATSSDGAAHDIQFYSDVNAAWITYESNKTVEWALYDGSQTVNGSNATETSSSLFTWLFYLAMPYEFAENFQFPEWGNFSYSSSPQKALNFTFESGFSGDLRYRFVMQHALLNIVDSYYRPSGTREPAFAYAHDLGSTTSASVLYTIGSIQQPIIRYLDACGLSPLDPWWVQCYGDIYQMISYHYNDFAASAALGAGFEAQLKADIDAFYAPEQAMVYSNSTPKPPFPYSNGSIGYADGVDQFGEQYIFDPNTAYGFLDPNNYSGIAIPDVSEAESYYSIVALAARQIMGAYVLTIPADCACSNSTDLSEPLMFQKEISSDGNVNTVDVMFPAMPFFLYANPNLLRYNLNPLYENQEGNFYPNGYSMHDLGTNFPNATGHVLGRDEYLPVEESGNMIIMTYAYYKFSGDLAYLQQHYAKMLQWSQYLIEYALIPGDQLSTDDFAGELANQTNLAAKGIVALAAMGEIASLTNNPTNATNFTTTAIEYEAMWEYFAIDPSKRHTLLAYQYRSSWGLLYNIYPDLLLDLGVIPQHVYAMQSAWYPQNSQVFGIPLDSRHSYTKSDWEMWTAATCAPSTRRLFVDAIAYWLNFTASTGPFTDLYNTIGTGDYALDDNGDPIIFIARPVQGGQFALLALGAKGRNENAGVGSANTTETVAQESAGGIPTSSTTTTSSTSSGPPEPPPYYSTLLASISMAVTQASDGQPQAPTAVAVAGAGANQAVDGHPQASGSRYRVKRRG